MSSVIVQLPLDIYPSVPGFSYSKEPYDTFVSSLPPTGSDLHNIGKSVDGEYDIYALSYGDVQAKPVMFILGGIHGAHEWRGAYIVRRWHQILHTPSLAGEARPIIERLKDTFAFYSVVMANPYGYVHNTYENKNGNNLNRNFASQSQPETQAVVAAFQACKPILFIDLHIHGGYYRWATGAGGTGEGNNNYRMLSRHSATVTSRALQIGLTMFAGAVPEEYARGWAAMQTSKEGVRVISNIVEPGELETDLEKSRIGLTAFAVYADIVRRWLEAGMPLVFGQGSHQIDVGPGIGLEM